MIASEVLADLIRQNVQVWSDGEHLRVRAPKGVLTPELQAKLTAHKAGVMELLEKDRQASVTVDLPRKHISFKPRRSFGESLSLNASEITGSASGQLCAQLYCIRGEVARNIYLPKDLPACEDGFIKHLVCTDSLTHRVVPERIRQAPEAEHTFEAYTSPLAIFKNQKRQIIGQTVVHILVDHYLRELPLPKRLQMAKTLKEFDRLDPPWLRRLICEHLDRVRAFWRLYPGLLTYRLKVLAGLKPLKRLQCLPVAVASSFVTLIASWMAYRSLKAGSFNYWPRAQRSGLGSVHPNDGKQEILINPS